MNTTLSTYKLISPTRATLEENVADASLLYARASMLQHEAWEEFNNAVDTGKSNKVKNDLYNNAVAAENAQHEAYRQYDDAKAWLLSAWN